MIENLQHLYRTYGGIRSLLKSYYLWLSVILTVIMSFGDLSTWQDKTLSIVPSLMGFSIASFAVILSVLNATQTPKLLYGKDGRPSAILRIASLVAHAVIIQFAALSTALIYSFMHNTTAVHIDDTVYTMCGINAIVSAIPATVRIVGTFLTVYGILLVVASALSVFRIFHIISQLPAPTVSENDE